MKERKKIIKGFNYGYELARNDKDLAKKIAAGLKEKDGGFYEAFTKGMLEFEQEEKTKQVKDRLKDRYSKDSYGFTPLVKGKEAKGKDDIEKEI